MPNSLTATPMEQLREQAKRLEAALAVGVARSTAKAVHELRSSTRRVEAQLKLLALVKGLPSYKPQAAKVHRRLEKLRRVAGKVRDCDVQLKLLNKEQRALSSAVEAPPDLKSAQEKLLNQIGKRRRRHELKLVDAIERQLPRLARDTEELLAALKPAQDTEVPVDELLAAIRQRIERMLRSREHGEEHLHDLRKAAKRARYQCEAMPGPSAAAMGRRLEELQDAGGAWHDLLDLTTVCHKNSAPNIPSPASSNTFATSGSTTTSPTSTTSEKNTPTPPPHANTPAPPDTPSPPPSPSPLLLPLPLPFFLSSPSRHNPAPHPRGRIFLPEAGATVEIAVANSDASRLIKNPLPTSRTDFLTASRIALWGNGKTPDAIHHRTPDLQALPSRNPTFGKPGPHFFGHMGAFGRLIHSSTPNDCDYGLLSIFKT